MFDTLKKEIKIGDHVRLFLVSGKEPEGKIIEIGDNNLLLLIDEGTTQRYFDKLIGGWEIINKSKIKVETTSKADEETDDNENKTEQIGGLKIVGKIDLDKIEKQKKNRKRKPVFHEPKEKIKEENKAIKLSGRFSSFEELGQVITEKDRGKLVPANAYIIKHSEERGFGFLRDPFEVDIYFNYKDIFDEELKSKIKGTRQHCNIQVCCSLSKNWKGEKAVTMHLPWTIEQSIEHAEKLIKNKDFVNAKNIAEQILKSFPYNIDAKNILNKLEKKRKATFYRPRGYDPIYYKAKKAKEAKNYDEAIKLFIQSIETDEKLDSSVKDLAATYQELGEIEKGIALLEKYIDDLPENTATYNFAANYYAAAGKFEKTIQFLDLLEDISPKFKLPDVYSRKAFALIQLEKFEDALGYVEDILRMKKENPIAEKMKEKLEEAIRTGVYEKLDSFVDDTDFSSFTGGLPPILLEALENCDYTGLKANVISKNEFSKTHLKQIRTFITEAGKARPRERAKYLLTEAKLIQLLEPENEDMLRRTLSRYCTALAISFEVEKYSPEITRYFHLLSFELENRWRSNATQVSNYLTSYLNKPFNSRKTLSIDELLHSIRFNENLWNGLIDLMISNSHISAVIVDKLFNDEEKRTESIKYASDFFKTEVTIKSIDEYRSLWNKVREKRKIENNKLSATIKTIQKITLLEELVPQLKNFETILKAPWLPDIDLRRIDDIFSNIYISITTYLSQTNFDDKEKFKGLIIGQISQLQEEIEEQPTKFSYNGLIPLLKHIELLTNQSFKMVLESSKPKVSISILGESRFLDEKGNVSIQIAVKNEKGCSPIHNINLKVLPNEDYFIEQNILTSTESLKGGDSKIITIPLIVNKSTLEQEATLINLKGTYNSRNSENPIELREQKLSVTFYSKENFEVIPNPFAAVADSGPVQDKSMFFGRDNLIKEISNSLITTTTNKCIIIQGQKRSGKSSLLYHLKENLNNTKKFICIDFSLGLTEELNSSAFFWQILNGISEYIEDEETSQKGKLSYTAPSLNELKENPSIIFYEQLKFLKKEFSKYDNWKGKKLLLMIDEFTYLYSAILKEKISPDFMKTWKSLLEKGIFSAVLIGQDVMPKFKLRFPNEFGVTEDRRLSYLKPEDAKELIEKPIWDNKNNRSRYIGQAIDKIIDYTSLNPYYIQIFCARLVDYMNDHKLIIVTEADVSEVAKTFTEGLQALPLDKFDNLLNAGDADLEAIPEKDTLEILKQIANNSRVIGSCSRDSIKLGGNDQYVDQILDDLLKRDVIVSPNKGYYRILVQIFNDWLIKH